MDVANFLLPGPKLHLRYFWPAPPLNPPPAVRPGGTMFKPTTEKELHVSIRPRR